MKNIVNAGIVTYNPNLSELINNLKAIINQVSQIIIVDNGSNNVVEIRQISKKYNCKLIENKINKGIANALNIIMECSLGIADWVLLLDQDSLCPANLIDTYRNYFNIPKLAVITPTIYDRNSSKKIVLKNGYTEINEFITSGSLNKVEVWNTIGRFNEKLFIDMVDWEFAYRLKENNYKIIKVNNICINHAIGKLISHNIGFICLSTYNHNAFRKYYITRNSIYLSHKYPQYLNPYLMYLRIVKRILIVILIEDEKKKKLASMFKGIKDWKNLLM